jgi:hypothetical protein
MRGEALVIFYNFISRRLKEITDGSSHSLIEKLPSHSFSLLPAVAFSGRSCSTVFKIYDAVIVCHFSYLLS